MSELDAIGDRLIDVPDSAWENLTNKTIFFGHQSVGNNILDGIRDLAEEHPQIKLKIVKTKNPADFKEGIFAHFSVGENMDPWSKMNDFEEILDSGIGTGADVAFLKFCFIDVFPDTDVEKVFVDYREKMKALQERYPNTTFIHFTVPITSNLTGAKLLQRKTKNLIKRIIGKPVYQNFENSGRKILNDKLRKEYGGKEPLFDIARIESTFPDGSRSTYSKDGKTFYSLVSDYTYDGAHLNEMGRKKVAEQLLLLLVNLK